MLTQLFTGLLSGHSPLTRWRLPSQCRVCHTWPSEPVCEACVNQFAQPHSRCLTCATALPAGMRHCGACLKNPPPLARCLTAVAYAYPWSKLIQDYKFHAQPGLVRSFATLLRAAPWVEAALDEADLLLPMPLSVRRLKERGYNQALLLARQLEPAKTRSDLLLRIRDTPAQHSLKRSQRLTVLENAFVVEPLQVDRVCNKRIVLIDDVMTTGASLFMAARTLVRAGAGPITGLVIARTD